MKKLFFSFVVSGLMAFGANAQIKTPPASPASTITQGVGLTSVSITYNRPSVKGRKIFGNLTPYGKVWRTGANQITSIKFGEDLLVNGKTLKAGSYGLYTVPGEKTWKIIFNSDDKQWGAYAYDPAKDVYSFEVPAIKLKDLVENMTIAFVDFTPTTTNVQISWENTAVKFKLEHDVKDRILADIKEKTADPNANMGTLMGAADYYYENNIELDKALVWAQKVIEKDQKYYTYQLAARIAAKMGKCDVALANAEKSMPLAKEAGDDAYIKLNEAVFAKCKK
ncbi:DUF2911 domain-containing protein [Emticicia sp. CRIBPO]|uniref:DUF2911 domain-containing protein n=1 Tax=Emticicia sp. CRIBPO TaxID=2683258 RepID=UPI0014129B63|nr:DUF2911 domain-containing protein [Emticicia sp. CRIBPO]NBA86422.1 DUF2911 domain-containing protein [Emticicia sp. CRIBPO]